MIKEKITEHILEATFGLSYELQMAEAGAYGYAFTVLANLAKFFTFPALFRK